jgi:hypothetical protein
MLVKVSIVEMFVRVVGGLGCVGAKANVLHCAGFERGSAALLILQKRWHIIFHFSIRWLSVVSSYRVAHNVPTLGAVGDFGKLNCQPARIYNRSTNFQ